MIVLILQVHEAYTGGPRAVHQKLDAINLVHKYLHSPAKIGESRHRAAQHSVMMLFKEHRIHAPSFAKSNLRRLPVIPANREADLWLGVPAWRSCTQLLWYRSEL